MTRIAEGQPAQQFAIKVSRRVIDKSIPCNARHCLIATAIRESIPGAWSILVTADSIRFNIGEVRYMYPMPARISLKAIEFDTTQDKSSIDTFFFQLGKNGTTAPVIKKGPKRKSNKKRKHVKASVSQCIRRYKGLRLIQVSTTNQESTPQ